MTERRLEVLYEREALELLQTEEVGRLAVIEAGHPVVLPVNYVMRGREVVFRTSDGMKLLFGRRGPVSFEVDCFDRTDRTGWSVLVRGRLTEVDLHDHREVREEIQALVLEPWVGGTKDHWVRVIPSHISGRRLRYADAVGQATAER